jgi:putative ABC transport system permease protein
MLANYLKSAFRNIVKQKGFFFINTAGLAVGIGVCLLLYLWIIDEWSYDRYHEKTDRIYRVVSQSEFEGKIDRFANTPAPLAPAFLDEFPEIIKAVRFGANTWLVGYESKRFYQRVFFADPEVFEVFTFPLVKGDPKSALRAPFSLVISETLSRKYFGDDDPMGKTLTFDEERDFTITGVMKDVPANSHFHFDALGSFRTFSGKSLGAWGISNYKTYILVSERFSAKSLTAKMPDFIEKYKGREARLVYKQTFPLQPLTSIHLHSHLRLEFEPNREMTTISIFSLIALFVLLIACLNYVNLASARMARRAKEAGLRKIIGASRCQLVGQFLSESFLLACLGLGFAVALAEIFLPLFNSLSGKTLSFSTSGIPLLLIGLAGILLSVGVAAGLASALTLSSVEPVRAVKGVWRSGPRASRMRRFSVVTQFALSVVFLVATFTIFSQLNFMREKKLGFDKEQMINIPLLSREARERWALLKPEFLRLPGVRNVSASSFKPGGVLWYQNYWYEGLGESQFPMIRWIPVDHDFLKTFGIKLMVGRDFSEEIPSDLKTAYILNESAVQELGWNAPLGKAFKIVDKGTVIGVIEDFHFESLHKKIEPMALCLYPEDYNFLSVRIRPGRLPALLDDLKRKWQELIPAQDFEYSFLDEDLDRLYKPEMRLGKTFAVVAGLAVLVACLGLFGLAAFTSEERTKEIGVRKVLGASVSQIYAMLCGEIMRGVLAANIIAWPVAVYFLRRWLQGFAYRVALNAWPFLGAAAVILGAALLTVTYQSLRAALADPVDSLKYE